MNIVGWFVSVPYRVTDDMNGIKKVHLDNFAGNDKVCFLSDRTEKEDNFFIYEQGSLEKQPGYYIYYEKNEKMKKYVKSINFLLHYYILKFNLLSQKVKLIALTN